MHEYKTDIGQEEQEAETKKNREEEKRALNEKWDEALPDVKSVFSGVVVKFSFVPCGVRESAGLHIIFNEGNDPKVENPSEENRKKLLAKLDDVLRKYGLRIHGLDDSFEQSKLRNEPGDLSFVESQVVVAHRLVGNNWRKWVRYPKHFDETIIGLLDTAGGLVDEPMLTFDFSMKFDNFVLDAYQRGLISKEEYGHICNNKYKVMHP